MKAQEMFEALGYERSEIPNQSIKYELDSENVFWFFFNHHTFQKCGHYDLHCDDMTMEELKAVNQQVKELGWDGETE